MKLNHIYTGDCTKILKQHINSKSVDMIYADPPYNASHKKVTLPNNKTGGAFYKVNEGWDKFTDEEYWKFSDAWIDEAYRVLKKNGSLYVSCSMHNIGEVLVIAKQKGFLLKNIITWHKANAMPNISKRTFQHSTEYVCWFVAGGKWIFNYMNLKKINDEKTKDGKSRQMQDLIKMPVLQGKERLKGKDGRAYHPTQKPEKLLEILITASTNKGDIVLDPFLGVGTTAAVAHKMKRRWIGIEKEASYVRATKQRLRRIT